VGKDISYLKKIKVYFKLGLINIIRVAIYRLSLKYRLHPAQHITATISSKPFFRLSDQKKKIPTKNKDWDNSIHLFGWFTKKINNKIPDWFVNPLSNAKMNNSQTDWWNIPDFGNEDIKCVWELSRFNWVIALSTKIANGDKSSLKKLNLWLENWSNSNPPFKGPNWKCGQETSIRVINLVISAWILGQDHNPESGLIDLIKTHLKRIDKTLHYGIAQQNNHATSEAAALFIGGSFLINKDKRAYSWALKGRQLLEAHASNLIELDGSFSQYSLNYHRVMLDTFSLVEAWRRYKNLKCFSDNLLKRLKAATEWLWTFIDIKSGEVPNIGANDGSQILQLSNCSYKNYKPSVQLASALFMNIDAFGNGPWNEALLWLKIPKGTKTKVIKSKTFDNGGYHVLRKNNLMAVLNYPKFRFRPSQADILHVDLWKNGENLLRDGGTFSYNSKFSNWYSSTAAHNTIEFDQRDQMPRISRFLFGEWPKTKTNYKIKNNKKYLTVSSAYEDKFKNIHKRKIILSSKELICYDEINGNFKEACLRWRLIPGLWKLRDKIFSSQNYSIYIQVNGKLVDPKIDKTLESTFYSQQYEVPLVYFKVNKPSTLITKFTF
tara:strand:- start:9840 stop:11657 length:1818 start_codon:yes stop_codon:yes gene_type:complete